ncbi:MAG TPA: hypothetical protein ENJ53_02585, partial [Phaeodactylibacter sp.]|nr:hypothetical protein [Phaeodactylibacter sp.]
MRIFYIIFFFIASPLFLFSQNTDCSTADVVCNNGTITFNPQGPGSDDFANPNNNEGCLASGENQSAWYYFEIDPAAPANQQLGFTISNLAGADFDFALYGPDVACGDLGFPIRCSFAAGGAPTGLSATATGTTEGPGGDGFVSEITIQPGQGYFLLIDNYSTTGVTFNLSWTGNGANSLNCNAIPPCGLLADAGNPTSGCAGDVFTLNGSAIASGGAETYSWVGSNGATAYLNNPNISNPTVSIPANVSGSFDFTLTVSEAGCSDSDIVTITISPAPAVSLQQPPPACASDGPFPLTANPSFGGAWSPNAPNGVIDPATLGVGTHTVTYTVSSNGCTNSATTTVTISPGPTVSIAPFNTQLCTNDAPFQITGMPAGGTWSANATGGIVVPLALGIGSWPITYSYTDPVTGCSETADVTVIVLPEPNVSITDPGPICETAQPVILNGTPVPSGGVAGTSIGTWSANAPSGVFIPSNYTPGTYPVSYTYQEVFGCSATATINIQVVPAPTVSISPISTLCTSSPPVTLTANPSGGTWGVNTPNGMVDPSVLGVGSHTIVYTYADPSGCLLVASENVTIAGPPNVAIVPVNNLCAGSASVTLSGVPNGGTWSNNASGGVFNPSSVGVYNITYTYTDPVTNCSETATTNITVSNAPTPTISGVLTICNGATTSLDAGAGYNSYSWSNGGNTSSISVSTAGTYTVTVSDAGGCTGTNQVTVSANPSPTPSISGMNTFCPGSATTLDAGVFDQYLWSGMGSGNTQTISANQAGTYTVQVTDANGCTATADILISENNVTPPAITGDLEFCENNSTTLTADGTYTDYIWSNGATTSIIDISQPQTVGLTVTDANGCTSETSVTVVQNPTPEPNITGTLSFCTNTSTTLDAGTFEEYLWSNGEVSQSISVDEAGTFTVTVTDILGCTGTDEVVTDITPSLQPSIVGDLNFCNNTNTILDAGNGYTNYLWSDSTTNSTISPNQTGTFTVTVTDALGCTGTVSAFVTELPPVEPQISGSTSFCTGTTTTLDAGTWTNYLWSDSNNSTTSSITVSTNGTYAVTVTDDNGCTGTASVEVTESSSLNPTIVGALSFCPNESTTLDAGLGFETYQWSDTNASSTQTISVNQTGDYTVTVTDASGCSGTNTVSVSASTPPSPQIMGQASFCTGSNSVLDAGLNYTSYLWSDNSAAQTLTVTVAGTYTVTVTDDNGCTAEDSFEVEELASLNPMLTGNTEFCEGNSTTISAANGFSYSWSDNSVNQDLEISQQGTYTVTVTDINGCTGEESIFITQNDNPTPSITGDNEICPNSNTTLSLDANFANYTWTDGTNNDTLMVNAAGTYTVTVTDDNGCVGTAEMMVDELTSPSAIITGTPSFCPNESTTLDAGNGFVDYIWSDGTTTTQEITVTESGTFTVTITDLNGCTSSSEIDVTVNTPPSPIITGASSFCSGNNTTLDATGNYTAYSWSNGDTLATITVNESAIYSVTVTDTNGCTGVADMEVTETTSLLPDLTGATSFCPNESTLIQAESGYILYEWSNGTND